MSGDGSETKTGKGDEEREKKKKDEGNQKGNQFETMKNLFQKDPHFIVTLKKGELLETCLKCLYVVKIMKQRKEKKMMTRSLKEE